MYVSEFKVGDIVSIENRPSEYFYIISSIIDFTQKGDDSQDIHYELVLIAPIIRSVKVELLKSDKFTSVLKLGTPAHKLLVDYIKKEREEKGISNDAYYLSVSNSNPENIFKNKNISKDSARQIRRMLASDGGERRIQSLLKQLDRRLEMYHRSLIDNRKRHAEGHLEHLKEIHRELMELEYFKFDKRKELPEKTNSGVNSNE